MEKSTLWEERTSQLVKTITIECNVFIDERFNEYTYDVDRWAVISLGNLENFLKIYGELLK